MAGPWEQYQTPAAPTGPWTKFGGAPAPETTPVASSPQAAEDTGAGPSPPDEPADVTEAKALGRGELEVLKGARAGFTKGVAGLAQIGLETKFVQRALPILAKVGAVDPNLRDRFTTFAAERIKQLEDGDPNYKPVRDVGEFIGEALGPTAYAGGFTKIPLVTKTLGKFIWRMMTSTAIGAGTEATQFMQPDDERSRLEMAGEGARGGAVFGVALEPLRAIGTRIVGTKFIRQAINEIRQMGELFDKDAVTVPQAFQEGYNAINTRRKQLYDARDALGDSLTQGGVKVLDVANSLQVAAAEGANKETRAAAKEALRGLKVAALPKGAVSMLSTLGEDAQEQILNRLGVGTVAYSRLGNVITTFETAAKKASGAAQKEIWPLVDRLKAIKTATEQKYPQLATLAEAADKHYSQVFQVANQDEFAALREARVDNKIGVFDANNQALDIATGQNAKLAKDMYNVMSPAGKRAVQNGIAARALDQAIDKDTHIIDPYKLKTFLRDSPAIKEFFPTKEAQEFRDGFTNLITKGSSEIDSLLRHVPGRGLLVWGMFDAFVRGQTVQGGEKIVAGLALEMLANRVFAATSTQTGMNFIRASGKLRPDSPAMTRAFNRLMTASSGLAGGALGDVTGISDFTLDTTGQAFSAFGQ